MPTRMVDIEGIGQVKLLRRRTTRNIRVSLSPTGQICLSMPAWVPLRQGLVFLESKREWLTQVSESIPRNMLEQGGKIGKAHRLNFIAASVIRVGTKVANQEVSITYPSQHTIYEEIVQLAAKNASTRALRREAEMLLPQRVASLASTHGFSYKSVSIKLLKRRWGSCDNQKNIVLSLYLMQLPWNLIDYVILHELAHTRELSHSSNFWQVLDTAMPNAKTKRKEIKQYHPILFHPN